MTKYIYTITVNYDTGDSFTQSPNQIVTINYEWDSIEFADENFNRINAHNEYVQEKEGIQWSSKTLKDIEGRYNREPWFSKENSNYTIVLLDNKGEPFNYCACWCGYFEHFNFAKIEVEQKYIKQKK